MVDFHSNMKLEFDIVVYETANPQYACYDMIDSTSMMDTTGIDIFSSKKLIYWDSGEHPMKMYSSFDDQESVSMCYILATEDPILHQAETRQNSILDYNYSKENTNEISNS